MPDNRVWENFKNDLKTANDIVDVISSYTSVVKKGKSILALCPFHGDRNPSMSINREGQFFKCFVCGMGGDVFKFVQEIENCSFMEAVEILARRVNMAIPQTRVEDTVIMARQQDREKCYEICKATAKHYHTNLMSEAGAQARAYLQKREISLATVKAFGLGLSLGYKELPDYLAKNKFALTDGEKAGVLSVSGSGKYYDFLSSRLIVPIIDINGKIIAFGGRILQKQPNVGKYVNTRNTPVFEKNKNLFGINLVKKSKPAGKLPSVIIVEGYMDVISLYQAGYKNVLASMGTALTIEQAKLLRRLSDKAYISYDGDSAGQSATLRGLDILKKEEIEVFVVSIPDNADPDDYVKQHGIDGYNQLLESALPLVDYKFKLLKEQLPINDDDSTKRKDARRKYLAEGLNILRELPTVERESYVIQLAAETAVTAEFVKLQLTSDSVTESPRQEQVTEVTPKTKALTYIAGAIVGEKPYATSATKPYCAGEPLFDKLFDYLLTCQKEQKPIDKLLIADILQQDYLLADAIISQTDFTGDEKVDENYYHDCYLLCSLLYYEDEKAKLLTQYSIADQEQKPKILEKITKMQARIKKLKTQKTT